MTTYGKIDTPNTHIHDYIWQNQAHFANLHTTTILNQNGRHRSTKQ